MTGRTGAGTGVAPRALVTPPAYFVESLPLLDALTDAAWTEIRLHVPPRYQVDGYELVWNTLAGLLQRPQDDAALEMFAARVWKTLAVNDIVAGPLPPPTRRAIVDALGAQLGTPIPTSRRLVVSLRAG